MTTPRAAITTALALAAVCVACSAIVQEIELHCERDSDCDALNREAKIGADACYVYQCRSDGKGCEMQARDGDGDGVPDQATCGDAGLPGPLDCQDDAGWRHPDAAEECDGLDNNCDGVIDEGALDGGFKVDQVEGLTLNAAPFVVPSAALDGPLSLAIGDDDGGLELWTKGTGAQKVSTRCLLDNASHGLCSFQDIALASNANTVLAAGVNTSGCGKGQVRVGASFNRGELTWVHSQDSALRLGIDPQTETSTATCTSLSGASHLSTALLAEPGRAPESAPRHGLVLWRDTGPWRSEAAELRGIAFDFDLALMMPRFITAKADISEPLPGAPGFDAAALVAWPALTGGGFFIAYDAKDSVELAFLPRRVTASATMRESMLLGEPIHARTPRHVALALDGQATDPETLALAAAWREGEGLRFAVISFDPERDPPLLAEHRGPIDDAHLVVAGPTLVFARAGFRTEASGRTGGWYVLWLEQAGPGKRLVGTRIAQADPRAEPHFVIDTEADPRALFAFSSDSGTAEVGVVAGGGQPDLHIGSLGCAVSQ